MVACLLGVWEVKGSIPCQAISKTLKMVLGASLLNIRYLKDRPIRKYGRLLYQCACDMAFRYGSTITATSRHHHDFTEIMLKVTLNWITRTHTRMHARAHTRTHTHTHTHLRQKISLYSKLHIPISMYKFTKQQSSYNSVLCNPHVLFRRTGEVERQHNHAACQLRPILPHSWGQ